MYSPRFIHATDLKVSIKEFGIEIIKDGETRIRYEICKLLLALNLRYVFHLIDEI